MIGVDGEPRRYEFLRCPGLCLPWQKVVQFYHLKTLSRIFDTSKRLWRHDNIWNSPFLCTRQPKVNSAVVKCTLSSLNFMISQLKEVKLRIKQLYSSILTKWESNKKTKKIACQRGRTGSRGCNSLNPFLGSARVFYLFYVERRNHFKLWAYLFQR